MAFFLVAVFIVTIALIPGAAIYRSLSRDIPRPANNHPPYLAKDEKTSWRTRVSKAVVVLAVAYAFMGFVCLSLFGFNEVETWGFFGLAVALAVVWLTWGRKHS